MARQLVLLGMAAGAVVALLGYGAYRVHRSARELHGTQMGLLDHLRELRYRVLSALAAVALLATVFFLFDLRWIPMAFSGVAWLPLPDLWVLLPVPSVQETLSSRLLNLLLESSLPATVNLVVLDPSEAIVAQIQASLLGAVLVASPWIAYQIAAFVAPALHPNELRVLWTLAPISLVLFLAGTAFGFFVIVPLTLETLYAYAGPFGADTLARPQETLSFILITVALFGGAFQLPLLMGGVAYVGLLDHETMARHWRGVVVTAVIAGAILSDPSPVTQVFIAGPLVVLYGTGLLIARVAWRAGKRQRVGEASPTA